MSHNSAAGHWFKLGSLTAGGILSFSRVAAAAKNPESFWLNRNRCARGTTTCTSWAVFSRTLYTGYQRSRTPGLRAQGRHARLVHRPLQGEPAGVLREFSDINQAIAREKEIKNTTQKQKIIELIDSINPQWRDLSQG